MKIYQIGRVEINRLLVILFRFKKKRERGLERYELRIYSGDLCMVKM